MIMVIRTTPFHPWKFHPSFAWWCQLRVALLQLRTKKENNFFRKYQFGAKYLNFLTKATEKGRWMPKNMYSRTLYFLQNLINDNILISPPSASFIIQKIHPGGIQYIMYIYRLYIIGHVRFTMYINHI